MMTKNLTKTFKGKINGQRLPPLPVTHEQSASATLPPTHIDLPPSILKKSKPFTEEVLTSDGTARDDDDDDDDQESSRVIFQKSQADVLLLLDTYPPKTWTVPKSFKSSYDSVLHREYPSNPMIDALTSLENRNVEMIETFPSPLSDRLPSSRYCRRSLSSACSRRSSIIFQRHTAAAPLDVTLLRREDTFDTVCESLNETLRASYTPLPPIPVDPNINLSKSLSLPSTTQQSSVSPPLISTEETPALQERKEEFTRRLLSKSITREATKLTVEKPMDSPPIAQKSSPMKPPVTARSQKPAVDQRRGPSVERHPAPPPCRSKVPCAASSVSVNGNHQRTPKFPLDIFQPQPKSSTIATAPVKKPTTTNMKTKAPMKSAAAPPKVKASAMTSDETAASANTDAVLPPSSLTIETSQVPNIAKTEELPAATVILESHVSPSQVEEVKLDSPSEIKRYPACRASGHYLHRSTHPVPKPLTLQGEKVVDADYPQTATRPMPSAMISCQRRGSLKGQPFITELFPEAIPEIPKPTHKVEPSACARPAPVKVKKQRPSVVKITKPKKSDAPAKAKTSTTVKGKVESSNQITKAEVDQVEPSEPNRIIIGGTDWMMSVKPQLIKDEEPVLSDFFQVATVDDEDLPSCVSPSDYLGVSQCTLMTSAGDLVRRNSIESVQAIEISPVLAQIIEHPVELTVPPPPHSSKPIESPLINTDIRTVYENVQDSMRKNTSLRSLRSQSVEPDAVPVKTSLPASTTSTLSNRKMLPFETSTSVTRTYNNSDTDLSVGPALRVVNDSLNSRGSETMDSTGSHEDYTNTPLCTEADCDEIYRTSRKGRPVGRGAYGIVWEHLTITGRVIAVKEIELDEDDSERVRNDYEAVREEINILRGLKHPYIVKFLGITLENTRLVRIFMEYLPNGTIENLLASFGPFHNDILKKYTRQIVEGVFYLHENGVVHRDIKGKNIMLDVDGNIKLIDFGCAKRLKKNQNTHSMRQILRSMRGTANWMAPEVIAETGHGKKADIWSIGCTLCEMATGKPPWSSENNHLTVLFIIVNGTKPPADLPATCTPAAQEFFRLCLTRDPAGRPSAKELLTHSFLL